MTATLENPLLELLARTSGRYTAEEWAKMVESGDSLDELTVINARAIAENILGEPELIVARALANQEKNDG